jgi:hypothetical protein
VGLEIIIVFLWGVQLIAGVVIAVFDLLLRKWLRAVGTLLGLVVGFLPVLLIRGPALWDSANLVAPISVGVLVAILGVRLQWKALVAVILILAAPLAYHSVALTSYPPRLNAALTFISAVAEMELLLGPIICAVTIRTLLGWLSDVTLVGKHP